MMSCAFFGKNPKELTLTLHRGFISTEFIGESDPINVPHLGWARGYFTSTEFIRVVFCSISFGGRWLKVICMVCWCMFNDLKGLTLLG